MDADALHRALREELDRRREDSALLRETTSGLGGASSLTTMLTALLARRLGNVGAGESTVREALDAAAPTAASVAEDVTRYVERDFTATTALDVLLFSTGFHALAVHRVTHRLTEMGRGDDARTLAGTATMIFGAELHPSASIGRRVFLDHGQGVVIGETATVGDDCAIFQGVTLGSTASKPGRRHPTLGRGVTVGAGAKIIGAIQVGDRALIGPNAVVTADVEAGARILASR